MYLKCTVITTSGMSIPDAIHKIPGVAVSHMNKNGEEDSENLYLGWQVNTFVTADANTPAETNYYTALYDSSGVDVITQAFNSMLAMDKYSAGEIIP